MPPAKINIHFFAGLFSFMLRKASLGGKGLVVGVGFEPTNTEAGGFTVGISNTICCGKCNRRLVNKPDSLKLMGSCIIH